MRTSSKLPTTKGSRVPDGTPKRNLERLLQKNHTNRGELLNFIEFPQ